MVHDHVISLIDPIARHVLARLETVEPELTELKGKSVNPVNKRLKGNGKVRVADHV
jgi:hypothetical protein